MRRSLLLILLFALPWAASPQPTAGGRTPSSNRFLFIVDTSDSAQGRFGGALQAVQDLLASGIGGQAQEGDSVGLWTFNEAATASHFPLQHWSASEQRAIAGRALAYLQTQKSPERIGIEKVLPEMNRVINDSAYITVILVSDGAEALHGTPFDQAINAAYKKWRKEQQKAKRPFVTVLQGKNGQFTGYSVSPAQWAIEMPALPPELSGRSLRQELLAKLEQTQPGARQPAMPAAPSPPRDKPQPAGAEEPPLVPGVVSSTVLPLDETAPPSKATAETNAPATTDSNASATTTQPAGPTHEDSSPIRPPPKPDVAQSAIAPQTIQVIPPPAPIANAPSPAPKQVPEVTLPPKVAAKPAPPSPESSSKASPQKIVEADAMSLWSRKQLVIAAIVFVGATTGLILLLMRRNKASDRVSLITRSLERQKER